MKKFKSIICKSALALALCSAAIPFNATAAEIEGWGDFKLFLDPGHGNRENQGMWGYSEAEKVLRVGLTVKEYLTTYTDIQEDNLLMCRTSDAENPSLTERTDMANQWGADFYYSIHSDASATSNTTVTLFGGWMKDGVEVEKTPNGGKAYGEILNPNLTGVMDQFATEGTRGNYYDRCFYYRGETNHANQYPYLHVNRESNMASLLSEGGYHTIAKQQQLNINEQYKRLEAFAAFQSILKYRGLSVPKQTFLAGIITNSENNQPINGVTVTVDGNTYTTDTWESRFNALTNNPDLIHNGFYFFEGLEAGKTYDVKFELAGFESQTVPVTIKDGGQGASVDFVTVQHITMTSNSPAKVDGTSIVDASAVSPVYPLKLTFSRNMDRASVEQALSINNGGEIALSWENDYTLIVDISKLKALFEYTLTIDGTIAKNSQTQQFLDGDGDGVAGGNYELTFTMAEPDVTNPEVVSTYPAQDGEVVYTLRPVIRIEYSEILSWNADKHAEFITVTDKDGNVYSGTATHAVVRDASVLHYYFDEDLPLDKAFLVTVKEGLEDLSGNVASEFKFRFLSEYRSATSLTTLQTFDTTGTFWAPDGSGSTKGLVEEANFFEASTSITASKESAGSCKLTYAFDEFAADELWQIRVHNPSGRAQTAQQSADGILTFWVYADGSNNGVSMLLRDYSSNGLNYQSPIPTMDYRGWNLIVWDLKNDPINAFTGAGTFNKIWYLDALFLKHEYTDPDDEETPFQAWEGEIYVDNLDYGKWDDAATRTAKLEDIALGVEAVAVTEIKVVCNDGSLVVSADSEIASIDVYAANGMKVVSVTPETAVAVVPVNALADGVYVAKVKSATSAKTVKFVK